MPQNSFDIDAFIGATPAPQATAQPSMQPVSQPTSGFDIDAFIAPPPEVPGVFASFMRGTAQGATMGFADEITAMGESIVTPKTYAQSVAESRGAYKAAQEASPIAYGAGELTGGVGSMLVAPGVAPVSLAAKVGLGALGGATAGLGYADIKDFSGKEIGRGIGEAAKGAAIGGAIPGVLGVGKKLLPGTQGSLANKATAEASRLFGTSKESAKTYKQMLDSPELYDLARKGKSEVINHVDDFYKPLAEETISKIKGAVGKQYQEGVKAAGERMAVDPKAIEKINKLDTHIKAKVVGESIEEIKKNPDFYTGKAKDVITEVHNILNNKYPGALKQEAEKAFKETEKRIAQLSKTGSAGKEQLALETKKLADLTKVNSMAQVQKMLDARRALDQAINYKKMDWQPSDYQRKLFVDMRNKLDEQIKTNPEIAKVDKFYKEYAESFKPLAKKLTNRETGDVEVNNVINFLKGGAGDAATAFNKESLEKADSFIRKEFSNDKELINQWNKFHDNARPFQLFSSLQGLKQTTGEFTGRAALTAAGLAGAGVLGKTAAIPAAPWILATMSPVKYLEMMHQLRKPAAKIQKVFKGKQTLVGTQLGVDVGSEDE